MELIFNNGQRFSGNDKYDNFNTSEDDTSSTMTIMNIELEDEGSYYCASSGSPTGSPSDIADITVEGWPDYWLMKLMQLCEI